MQNEAPKKKQLARRKKHRGMTLIEIMVVITILGLIAAAVGIAVIPKLEEAKVDTAKGDIRTIEQALDAYYAQKGSYPDTASGLNALVQAQDLKKTPMDPWGNPYVYLLENNKPLVKSYGHDKQADTQDDISSETLDGTAAAQK